MIGEVVGNYRVVGELGKGGMGVVYQAEHVHLGRPVALKVLLPSLSTDPAIVQRFFNEARAASAIDHPGIVDIYDFGVHADGRAYIVMELLRGENLQRRLERGAVTLAEGTNVVAQVAGALAAAHAQGIIHRDLKPDNIFLCANELMPGGIHALLLDFGIAKLADERVAGLRTQTGSLMGTPAYMSPEQCMGKADIDQRTDLYSLGCVLFHVLCGRPPFLSEHGTGMMIAAQIRDLPPPPRSLNPDIPEALAAITSRLLEKDPAARFQTAQELRAALVAAGASVPATRPPRPGRSIELAATVASPEPEASTTRGGAAGQLLPTPAPAERRRSRLVALSLVVVALGLVAAGTVIVLATRDGEGDPVVAAGQPAAPPVPADTAAPAPPSSPSSPTPSVSATLPPPTVDAGLARREPAPRPPDPVPPGPSPGGGPAMRLAKRTVTAGEPIEVRFTAPVSSKPNRRAWVTVVEASRPPSDYGAWAWVADGARSIVLTAPRTAGQFEVRLHTDYPVRRHNVKVRLPLTVTAPAVPADPTPTPDGQQRFTLSRQTLGAGDTVVLTFAAPMHARKGERFWVTIVERDKPDSAWGRYEYLPAGATSLGVDAPDAAGAYEVRLHANYPTRATNVVHRAAITVE